MRGRLLRELLNATMIALGILSAGMGLEGFLKSSGFIDGGVTGICMLIAKTTRLPLSLLLPVFNLPFIALGYHQMGRAFAVRSTLAILGLAIVLETVHFHDVTEDLVLTAVFGGFFLGAGIGLAIRGGAVLDGTEIAALLIGKRSHLLRVGDAILSINVVIFLVAIFVLGVEKALYSILTYMAAARTLDFLVHGIEQYTSITIISDQSRTIRERIVKESGRGVTVFKGLGGMSGAEQEILYCVVTRLEIGRIKGIVREVDPSAFVVTQALADADGGFLKKTGGHN
jgi:uncharacterized membrane-anchored protein YitT (DUF2179 family)